MLPHHIERWLNGMPRLTVTVESVSRATGGAGGFQLLGEKPTGDFVAGAAAASEGGVQ